MRIVVLALVASSVAACANDATSPQVQPAPDNSVAVAGPGAGGPWAFGRHGMGMGPMMMFASRRLPDNLKLTEPQRTQIRALVTTFRASRKDLLDKMRASATQAFAARKAGVTLTADQRKAMFAQMAPVRQQLMAANTALRAQIEQVLTPEQTSWLASHRPTRPPRRRAA